jgi:hypothetical protein
VTICSKFVATDEDLPAIFFEPRVANAPVYGAGAARRDADSLWHDPSFVTGRQRARNLRFARHRRRAREVGEEYVSLEHEGDLVAERPALRRQVRDKKPGDPSRAVPIAFDGRGDFVKPLRGRIPDRQARQARLLLEQGLLGKARRQAWCGLIGRRRDCFSGNSGHTFYTPCFCGNRYCPTCGPRSFRNLFSRHVCLRAVVEELLRHRLGDHREHVLAKLDITTRNVGEMPTAEKVRRFNEDIKQLRNKVIEYLEIKRGDCGILYCDEFGSGNTNLHAHGIYCGPWIPQKKLSQLWSEIREDGSFVISIKRAKSFEAALGHALKYPSKFFEASEARLVDLEIAFDGVRRFMPWVLSTTQISSASLAKKGRATPGIARFAVICYWTRRGTTSSPI